MDDLKVIFFISFPNAYISFFDNNSVIQTVIFDEYYILSSDDACMCNLFYALQYTCTV